MMITFQAASSFPQTRSDVQYENFVLYATANKGKPPVEYAPQGERFFPIATDFSV
jgi:hypothetical protein